MNTRFKFYPRLKMYKNSTATLRYYPDRQIAFSYRTYEIYKIINGVRCLNTHSYSVTTAKHVSILWKHFNYDRNIFAFEAPRGLQDLDLAIQYYRVKNKILAELITKPRSHAAKNKERQNQIEYNLSTISKILKLKGEDKTNFHK